MGLGRSSKMVLEYDWTDSLLLGRVTGKKAGDGWPGEDVAIQGIATCCPQASHSYEQSLGSALSAVGFCCLSGAGDGWLDFRELAGVVDVLFPCSGWRACSSC